MTLKCKTRRRWCERTTNTNNTRNVTVGTTKKSTDTSSFMWFFRNALHVPDGGFLVRIMYFSTVDLATVMPILASSPTMRGDPQVEFTADICRMSCRTSFETGGRPGLPQRLSRVQCSRNLRCRHRTTVAGLTKTKTRSHLHQTLESQAQKRRSAGLSRGRFANCLQTASWCRSAKISNCIDARLRKNEATKDTKALSTLFMTAEGSRGRIRKARGRPNVRASERL